MKFKYLAAVSLVALSASGCASTSESNLMPVAGVVDKPADAPMRADVNPGYKAGTFDFKTKSTRSLSDIMAKNVHKTKSEDSKTPEDRLRDPAMRDAALAYGTQAGLAFETANINRRLQDNAALLSKTYDFKDLMIQGPNGTMVQPPVISQAVDSWEAFDAGKTLRVADTVYEIISQARFSPVSPMWQSYVVTSFPEAQDPPDALLPQSEDEKVKWNKWIAEGWEKGREQAHDIFKANLARLNRDFTGMVRYRALLEEKKVSAPILAVGNLGTTGTGQDMRVNDQAIRMTREPTLQIHATGWDASATTKDANGEDKGPATPPKPTPAERPAAPPKKPAPKHAPKHVDHRPSAKPASTSERTDGGSGRF